MTFLVPNWEIKACVLFCQNHLLHVAHQHHFRVSSFRPSAHLRRVLTPSPFTLDSFAFVSQSAGWRRWRCYITFSIRTSMHSSQQATRAIWASCVSRAGAPFSASGVPHVARVKSLMSPSHRGNDERRWRHVAASGSSGLSWEALRGPLQM